MVLARRETGNILDEKVNFNVLLHVVAGPIREPESMPYIMQSQLLGNPDPNLDSVA